ncbi:MAG: class I SAM-dependent methyltransferase [Deltaproteobacteria bacterium]|nr:class I SAM-dependent methyltransferase [Candidatus Zymogenaceae bacterium]
MKIQAKIKQRIIRLALKYPRVTDFVLAPFIYVSGRLLRFIRREGIVNFPRAKNILMNLGVFPIFNHYYEPRFDNRDPKYPFSQDRILPGIDWNITGQLALLDTFTFSEELLHVPETRPETLEFFMNNATFGSGDAEYWYQLIRSIQPGKIYEIGSGNSTLMAIKALRKNRETDPGYECRHVCIEPYEMPWLEQTGVTVIRRRVEDIELDFFYELDENDILFIDSSHIIKPQGDVLFEYLSLLPSLKKGVIVHVHDIFSPKDYPKKWLEGEVKFWNEQYLLEAFLSHNKSWKIIGALNYLKHNHYDRIQSIAPFITPSREPGSFYIQKIL